MLYVGLDISQKQTWICVVDEKGLTVAEGVALTRARDVFGWLDNRADVSAITKVGLEAGNMSSWLYSGLSKLGLPVVCLESFQAHRFLSVQRNKTDKNDARGLAQLTRMGEGFLKLVTIRSQGNQEMRALLGMREHLVKQKMDLENHISGILKPFGLIVGRGNVAPDMFRERVIEALRIADAHGVRIGAINSPERNCFSHMSRRPARCTQADIRRALAAMEKVGSQVALDILPDGTLRFTPTGQINPAAGEDGEFGPKRRIVL